MTDAVADVVVLGGGAAGATAVRTLLAEGHPGRIVLVSSEEAAPYDRTHLSKAVLTGERDRPAALYTEELHDPRLEIRLGTSATALDLAARRLTLSDGSHPRYGTLLLATGAAPRQLPLPGADLEGVHLVREVATTPALRTAVRSGREMIVIGGGLIGLEVAAAARAHGTSVTVLEVGDRLMGRVLPARVAAIIAEEHAAHGVRLELGVRPTSLVASDAGRVVGVALADGRTIAADDVVIAVGALPRTELAVSAGLEVDDGVLVDRRLRTSDHHVLAAGDLVQIREDDGTVGRRTEAWTPAVAMGQHAARVILGADEPYDGTPWMWSDQYDLRIQAAGGALDGLELVSRGDFGDRGGLALFGIDGGRVRGVVGISRGARIGRTVRAGQNLIQHGTTVTPEQLADPAVELRRLVTRR